ncbi:MAG: hypothetical protein ACR2H0_07775 [Candidatus Limnocylindrales bacterium]
MSYLGADLPIEDWVASSASAVAAVVGLVTDDDVESGLDVAAAIRRSNPGVVVALGGRSAPADSGYQRLPDEIGAAVTELQAVINQTAQTGRS